MKTRISMDAWGARLLAALSLSPVAFAACGDAENLGVNQFPCEAGEPVVAAGADSGYERCASGMLHRNVVKECASKLPRAEACSFEPLEGSCASDADCTEKPNGHCSTGEQAPCSCNYGCTKDSDCASGQICLCSDPVGRCVASTCTSDADCNGALCASYISEPGCGGTNFACQKPDDECGGDKDCGEGQQCTLSGDRHVCEDINCAIGRPFLVDGSERLAPAALRGDWRDLAIAPEVLDDLEPALRARLADHWARAGLMEHASIAAFARFSLQLLASGAPPELVSAANAAMEDETRHARACFSLASAYAGSAVGPGRLAIDRALDEDDEPAWVVQAILEGCIGETVAALEAAESAEHCTDPAVRALLERIAADETRHAELAWRYVAWMLETGGSRIAEIVRTTFERQIASARNADVAATVESSELACGVMSSAERASLRRRALVEVIAPCARALLASPGPERSRAKALHDRLAS